MRTLGVQLDHISPEAVAGRLPFSHDLSTVGGGLHGGALMGLAGGAARDRGLHTTHFLRPVVGEAAATVSPVRSGGRQVLVEIRVADESGTLCVHVLQTARLVYPGV